jgi:UDP-2-acetamido-2-deoxy-ribo-hexuluronate aminotransferase
MLNSLKYKEISSVSYQSVPLQLQPVFKHLGHQAGDFPVAEKVANQCLSLPMSPYLKGDELNMIIDIIQNMRSNLQPYFKV